MRGGLAEVPAAECRRTAGSRHSAAGRASGDSGVGKLPAPDESKAEHIQAETVTRGLGRWAEEGARPENFNPKNKIRRPDKPCGDFKEIGKITLLL